MRSEQVPAEDSRCTLYRKHCLGSVDHTRCCTLIYKTSPACTLTKPFAMQEEASVCGEIPAVSFDKAAEEVSETMGSDEKEDEQAYRDFVTAFLNRLCENCKKMREQIIIRAKCAGILPEDDDNEHTVPEFLATLIPETQLKLVETLRRRTVWLNVLVKPFPSFLFGDSTHVV